MSTYDNNTEFQVSLVILICLIIPVCAAIIVTRTTHETRCSMLKLIKLPYPLNPPKYAKKGKYV